MIAIASSRRYARNTARTHILAQICAMKQSRTKSFSINIGTILKNMPTNFELKRYKPKLDIVEIPENRVHKLTDSNGTRLFYLTKRARGSLSPPSKAVARARRAFMQLFYVWFRPCIAGQPLVRESYLDQTRAR